MGVPYVVVPGDGDSVVAAVANELGGYVLANDTDFCVYNLTKGFLPLSDLDWENVSNQMYSEICSSVIDMQPNRLNSDTG